MEFAELVHYRVRHLHIVLLQPFGEDVLTLFLYFCASLPIAFGGLFSGIAQGRTAAAGVGIIAKKPDESGKAIIMAAMVETYAILALLISILIIYNI